MSIAFPTKLVSSVAFGGEDLTDIYCTTIGGDNRAEYGPGAGALFRLQLGILGIKGVPDYYSRVGLLKEQHFARGVRNATPSVNTPAEFSMPA